MAPEPTPLVYQDKPRCFGCCGVINDEPVFSAICGHAECASATWYYHHFMQAREAFEAGCRRGGTEEGTHNVYHLLQSLREN